MIDSVADLTGVLLFGGTISEMMIRDKFGSSAMGKLLVSEIAWPLPFVILVSLLKFYSAYI